MSDEQPKDIYAISEALQQIALNTPMKSGIELDGLSLRPQHELDAFSMGSGITARTLEMFGHEFGDQVVQDITDNRGTTIFLGNGSSLVPLEISQKQRERGHSPNTKVIIDQVNLELLLEDLKSIESQLNKMGFTDTFDIGKQRERIQTLVEASMRKEEELSMQTGLIGKDDFANLNGTGDVIVNAFGPSDETLEAQLMLAKPGGVLYISCKPNDLQRMADKIGSKAFAMIEKVEPAGKWIKITRKSS